MQFRGTVCLILALAGAASARCSGQEFASAVTDAGTAFLSDAEAEAARGMYLLYSQSFLDKQNERIVYRGSLYGVLRDVKLTGCEAEANVQIFDLFSGSVNNRPTGELQDLTEYQIRFHITAELAGALSVMQGRPAQLSQSRHTQCDGDPSCAFNWLSIQTGHPVLHQRIVSNRLVTFDGDVNRILAPVSSVEAGNRLIRDLKVLAQSRCR
ncbi:MAG TPA: hypothetical protein VG225_15505 [Terracidiphilus sp.]|jgi:hypothetical protein|nr:hypothetical protein [Terracidiphilus sp.]